MSKQVVLSYRVGGEQASQNLTALSGLAPYVDLMVASGLLESVERHVDACGEQGWTDQEIALSLVLLNLAGGDCVDDLDHLNADAGFGKLLKWCGNRGLSRRIRRKMLGRWRKAKNRSVASPSVARRRLGAFHDAAACTRTGDWSAYRDVDGGVEPVRNAAAKSQGVMRLKRPKG